jgi:hypothetical protein
MIERPATVRAPRSLWRIGRGDAPLAVARPDPVDGTNALAGNRFDSATGDFGVLYFGSTLEACFGETLARHRPSMAVVATVKEEWERLGFMAVGAVAADWRTRRTAVEVSLGADQTIPFLDIEALDTHSFLRPELALGLSSLGYQDLDVALVRGPDRRVTRLVAEWAYRQADQTGEPLYAGMRYVSRICSEWECWAVFEDIDLEPLGTKPITLDMPALQQVAKRFDLLVF